jgi:hypothetical protein
VNAYKVSMLAWTLPLPDWKKLHGARITLPADLRALLKDQERTVELATQFEMEWPVDKARKLLPHAVRLRLRSAWELARVISVHDQKVINSQARLRKKKPR